MIHQPAAQVARGPQRDFAIRIHEIDTNRTFAHLHDQVGSEGPRRRDAGSGDGLQAPPTSMTQQLVDLLPELVVVRSCPPVGIGRSLRTGRTRRAWRTRPSSGTDWLRCGPEIVFPKPRDERTRAPERDVAFGTLEIDMDQTPVHSDRDVVVTSRAVAPDRGRTGRGGRLQAPTGSRPEQLVDFLPKIVPASSHVHLGFGRPTVGQHRPITGRSSRTGHRTGERLCAERARSFR